MRSSNLVRASATVVALLAIAAAGCAQKAPPTPAPAPTLAPIPTAAPAPAATVAHITIQGASGQAVAVTAEVADTTEKLLRGLMFRRHLPPDRGMLFDFGGTVQVPFYMKNTYIPLSIAFVSAEGEIVDILDMEPLDEQSRAPAHPYRYALEVNRGFFETHGLGTGDRVTFR
ncbi:MAG: DUF192 domain-containing protein [Dehalococcoidia bacterium]